MFGPIPFETGFPTRVLACASFALHSLHGRDKHGLHTFPDGRKRHGQGRGWGRRKVATAEHPSLATSTWDMLYADDAALVSQSPEQFRKVIVVSMNV